MILLISIIRTRLGLYDIYDSDEVDDRETVASRFLSLGYSDSCYVMDSMRKNTTEVRNIRGYLLTVLYNAPTTKSHFYKSAVNHDMYGRKAE